MSIFNQQKMITISNLPLSHMTLDTIGGIMTVSNVIIWDIPALKI